MTMCAKRETQFLFGDEDPPEWSRCPDQPLGILQGKLQQIANVGDKVPHAGGNQ